MNDYTCGRHATYAQQPTWSLLAYTCHATVESSAPQRHFVHVSFSGLNLAPRTSHYHLATTIIVNRDNIVYGQ